MNIRGTLVPLALCLLLSACVNQSVKSTSVPAIKTASTTVEESLLLDVGIAIFDPGLDDYEEEDDVRIYPEVRRAEALFMPGLLSEAIQESGAWGAVRVMPDNTQLTDLMVQGKILYSDGEELRLAITAHDSRGNVWLNKEYRANASRYAYDVRTYSSHDPFQAVYNNIANDLLEELESLRQADRENIRLVSELLFARSFSPDAFADYIATNPGGNYLIMRLPAEDDPMLHRVRTLRERDHVFIDTMQEYYVDFDSQMAAPYQEWRKYSFEEAMALDQVRADARRRMIAGGIAVLAGIAAATSNESGSDGNFTRAAGNIAILSGGYLLKSGLEKRHEAQIHVEALEELGTSLESEITPKVIELEDRSVTLSGNVQQQYSQWRELLADIYRAEIGELELPQESAGTTDTL